MKKILIALAALTASAPVSAGLTDIIQGMGKKTVEPVAYTIATSGYNLRVYEWPSQLVPGKTCTVVTGESFKGSVSCTVEKQ